MLETFSNRDGRKSLTPKIVSVVSLPRRSDYLIDIDVVIMATKLSKSRNERQYQLLHENFIKTLSRISLIPIRIEQEDQTDSMYRF